MNTDETTSEDQNEITPLVAFIDSRAIESALKRVPTEMWLLSEPELRERARPTHTEELLRHSLWTALRSAMPEGKKVKAGQVHTRICSHVNFFAVLKNPQKVAWMFQSPSDFSIDLEILAHTALDKMREILEVPLRNEFGFVDYKMVDCVTGIVKLLSGLVGFGQPTNRASQNPQTAPVGAR